MGHFLLILVLIVVAIILLIYVGPILFQIGALLLAIVGFLLPGYLIFQLTVAVGGPVWLAVILAILALIILGIICVATDGVALVFLYMIEVLVLVVYPLVIFLALGVGALFGF